MAVKAFGYLRVSGLTQVDGNGLDRQEEVIQSFADANGYEIAGWFREEGVSGTKGEEDRPAFMRMVTEILRDGVTTVIVESLDRLAREYRIQEQLLIYLVAKGIDLIAANTGETVTQAIQADPMRKAMVQIQGIFSELDKSLLVRKLRLARERVREETGKCGGRRRFGEDSEEEAKVVRRIKLMRRRRKGGLPGMTLQQIADTLNDEGVPTKTGKKWSRKQVLMVLRRPA
jgi:DNA invertase Pin-like site-specific DNA recombinase